MARSTLLPTTVILLTFHPMPVDAQAPLRTPRVTGSVIVAPTPVVTSDGVVLAYELHLTNRDNRPLTLTRLEVLREDGSVLLRREDSLLHQHLGRGMSGRALRGAERAELPAGSWAIAWMWIMVRDTAAVPRLLRHRLTMELEDRTGARRESVREVGSIAPGPPAIELGPPMGEGLWKAARISNTSGHRRGIDEGGHIPQRFAIDFSRIDDFGRNRTSDLFVNENHFAFGAPVLAVADGIVLSAADSMAENSVGRQPVRHFPATLGNYVDLEIAPGVYALYLHLQSGSVTVRAGDTVTRGQAIGRLGNTGASIAPHLHFQLNTRSLPAGRSERGQLGEGLPFVFSSYALVGENGIPHCRCEGTECSARPLDMREHEMPMDGQVVRFVSDSGGAPGESEPTGVRRDALCHVAAGLLLRDEHRIPEAVAAYERAVTLDPGLEVPALQFGALCWRGSLWEFAEEVMGVCNQAVATEPDHPDLKRRRALARALTGDLVGAVADLDEYLAWLSTEPPLATWEASFDGLASRSVETLRAQVMEWSRALREGRNPFTSDVLEALRNRTRPPQ
ncbi:MAG: peptidoglycan DD-metalloendopeptidase family protein [Gemmatimonadales bacterium]|nr:peptidoglycan DD-metalloendopeptidase family protein [Gemmatimonadales bacterium]